MWSVDFEGEGIFCMKKIILKLRNTKKNAKIFKQYFSMDISVANF